MAGLHFVVAELFRHGFKAEVISNAEGSDLLVRRGQSRSFAKVVTIPTIGGWPISRAVVRHDAVYVFVCLNGPNGHPDFYVAQNDEVAKATANQNAPDYRAFANPDFQNAWHKIGDAP
jgi:hypothetical protein